jgi:hypothetical protein
MTLKKLIKEALSDYKGKRFDVVAFELWGNTRDGFDCNSSFFIDRSVDIDGAIEAAQGRWHVFKVNYMPRAALKDARVNYTATNIGEWVTLECACVPFLEIRVY